MALLETGSNNSRSLNFQNKKNGMRETYKGYLMKKKEKSNMFGAFNKRFFVMDFNTLMFYYKDKEQSNEKKFVSAFKNIKSGSARDHKRTK